MAERIMVMDPTKTMHYFHSNMEPNDGSLDSKKLSILFTFYPLSFPGTNIPLNIDLPWYFKTEKVILAVALDTSRIKDNLCTPSKIVE